MVSVIIPAYNAEATLGDAVESVRNQTFHGWELILVNDGSSDSTASICDSFADSDCRIRAVQGGRNSGAYSARLKGVECSKNEWILFLDADDVLLPDALEALLAFDNGKRSIIAGNIVLDNKIVRQNNPSGDLTSRCYLNAILSRSVYIEVCAKLIRRDIFSLVFAFSHLELEVNEDMLMLVSLLPSATKVYVSNSITCYVYRGFDDNVRSRKMKLDNWYKLFDALEHTVTEIGDRESRRLFIQYEIQSLYLFPLRINGNVIPNDTRFCKIIRATEKDAVNDECKHILAILLSPIRQRAKRFLFYISEVVIKQAKSALIWLALLSKEWLIKRIYL